MGPQQLDLSPPKNWQDFEDLCHALWEREWDCPTIQRNGRSGQKQRGVDIFGRPRGHDEFFGIQCKLKSGDTAGPPILTRDEVEEEVAEAKGFAPPLKHLIIATTAPSDANIQVFVRELSERHGRLGLFQIDVMAWPEIKARLAKHEPVLERYYPGAGARLARIEEMLASLADQVSREKGVPAAPLRSVLEKLGEAGVPDHEIPTRLNIKADELVELRVQLSRLRNDRPELATIREQALGLMDRGELDRARAVLNRGREAARALREEASRDEAELLADEARIDHLQLAYRNAAKKYAEAVILVRPFDRDAEWRYTQSQAIELYSQGGEFGDNEALIEAIGLFEHALTLAEREREPLLWASTQHNLGTALSTLGERESDPVRLEKAIAAYHEALKERTRDRAPLDWAKTQNNLGLALKGLAERRRDTALLEEAIAAHREALKEYTREFAPFDWARAQNNLGVSLRRLGEWNGDNARLEEAVAAHRDALKECSRERAPFGWAELQNNLGNALLILGAAEGGTATLEQAITAYRAALSEWTCDRAPLDWATAQTNLGRALYTRFIFGGERERNTRILEEAIAAYREALKERGRERDPLAWASTQHNLGVALCELGERARTAALLEEAITTYHEALKERTRDRAPLDWAKTQGCLERAERLFRDGRG
jgi:tetratricopeptide (TPR) repeat protein